MVQSIVDVMLFSFINEMFNFCINNIVGKPIIDKGLFCIFKLARKEESSLGPEMCSFMIVLSLRKLRVQGLMLGGFSSVEVVNL